MNLDAILAQYLGSNPSTYMVVGVIALIIINLIVTLWLAAKSNSIQFHMLGDFVIPSTTHALFLVTMGILTYSTKHNALLSGILGAMQGLGFAAVMISYAYQIYTKLKQLGMPITPAIDAEIQAKLDALLGNLANVTPVHTAPVVKPIVPASGILVDVNHTPVYVPPADAVLVTTPDTPAPPAPINAPKEDGR